jgi:ribosomal protein S18 acetylase RimI-like enzyme
MIDQSKIIIRKIRPQELYHLEDFLYTAIYQPDKENLIPRDVIKNPAVSMYIDNFGKQKNDYCLVAEYNGELIGAVWIRILAGKIKGYGNIDEHTPEFATAVFENYQKQGVGTMLMNAMIEYMRKKKYTQTSLSVIKENYAVKLYKKAGFEIIDENKDDYLMLLKF